jgi:hypothetical protein
MSERVTVRHDESFHCVTLGNDSSEEIVIVKVSWQRAATLAQGREFWGQLDCIDVSEIRMQSIQQQQSRHELAMAAQMQATTDLRQVVCEYGAGMGIVRHRNTQSIGWQAPTIL